MAKATENTITCAIPNARGEQENESSDGKYHNMSLDRGFAVTYTGPVNQYPAPTQKELRMRFEFAEPVRRGRKPTEIPPSIAGAIAFLVADDETPIPLAWRKGRARRTYLLRDGRRVILWVRRDARAYKPGTEWAPCPEKAGIFIPAENTK